MRVAIAGAGNVGQALAAELLGEGHDVLLIEKEPRMVATVRRRHPKASVLVADACEVGSLSPAELETADAAIAATGEDQVNLVFSLLASQEFAIPRVVARVNDPRNAWLFNEAWGIDAAVSTPSLLASAALEAMGSGVLLRLQALEAGGVHICSATIREGQPSVDRRIGDLDLPMGAVVAAIVREGVVVPADPDQVIGLGDEILVITEAHTEAEVATKLLGDDQVAG